MTASKTSLVHFYDTMAHRILCGVRGVDHHSSKHSRSVTCQTCLSLLIRERTPGSVTNDTSVEQIAR